MSLSLPITIVDVFAEQQMAGNQLAVVHEAGCLTDAQMLAIARETNFSETTFVTQADASSATVRIFTPSGELSFAGHPTIGTAWTLTGGVGSTVLNLGVGPVAVEFNANIGWMRPPEVALQDGLSKTESARLVGLDERDLAADLPVTHAQIGPRFLLVPVNSLAALRDVTIDPVAWAPFIADAAELHSIFVFTRQAYSSDADYAARMFFNDGGVREDAATGSANTAFAAYLQANLGNVGSVIVEQGFEMHRPSRLYLEVNESIRVGGKVQLVVRGEIFIDPDSVR